MSKNPPARPPHTRSSADEGNEAAANILQHLATMLSEERDKKLPAETRLLRMLLRTKKQEERLSMLLEKLLLANPPPRPKRKDEETGEEVEEEPFWGPPEVRECRWRLECDLACGATRPRPSLPIDG
jgi:hypothetical protein